MTGYRVGLALRGAVVALGPGMGVAVKGLLMAGLSRVLGISDELQLSEGLNQLPDFLN